MMETPPTTGCACILTRCALQCICNRTDRRLEIWSSNESWCSRQDYHTRTPIRRAGMHAAARVLIVHRPLLSFAQSVTIVSRSSSSNSKRKQHRTPTTVPKAQHKSYMSNSSLPSTSPHPERFWVDYVMEASTMAEARKLARELCLEQTVELPGQIDAVKQVEGYIVGTVESVKELSDGIYRVTAGFPNETAGGEMTQFLNVVFGNTSLKKGISVANVTLSRQLTDNTVMFPGPKFGIQGLRDLIGVPQAPLLCTALKPMGKSSREFADMAYALARGGMDIIKDDHGLANQVWAPFEERVRLCAQAVQKANAETNKKCLYAPCLNAPAGQILRRARYAEEAGAGAVMVLPGIVGWDVVRELAADPSFRLPILVHPAMLGGWLHSEESGTSDINSAGGGNGVHHQRGLSHEFLFGVLPRLCGGDAVIFPNSSGRFQFTRAECEAVAEACRRPMGRFEPIFPSPAGGMILDRVDEMRRTFGEDLLLLIGGALLEQGPDLEADAKLFAHCAGRDRLYVPLGDETIGSVSPYSAQLPARDAHPSIRDVEKTAMAVRRRVLEYTLLNNGGYLSQACSSAEILATLYLRALNLGPSIASGVPGLFRGSPGPDIPTITGEGHNGDFNDPSLDRLIFSPVHYALVLYSLLVELGRLDIAAFRSYNKDGSTVELIGAEHSPGHGVTAGSLAQALSQAAGIAHARKLKGHTGRVFVYMSDGEFQEGQTWEAIMAAVFHGIGNLVAVVDVNGQQCDGKMSDVTGIENLACKISAFGAIVKEVDGHSVKEIEAAIKIPSNGRDASKPTVVLCYTDPCHGLPLLKKLSPDLHYVRFKDDNEKRVWAEVLVQMTNGTQDDRHCQGYPEIIIEDEKKAEECTEEEPVPTKRRLHTMEHSGPSKKKATVVIKEPAVTACSGRFTEMVTRPHRSHLVQWVRFHPKAIVLTADLTKSCEADLLRDELPDQYMSLGMAEQNMMSFAGGLAREGYHPYIHTFAVFVTRRPFDQVAMSIAVPNLPVRLMGFLPGLTTPGGVTHQAIDDVALMRAIPNMRILEVGDATEVESVLDVAESIDGPVYVRMWRGQVPRLFPKMSPMIYGVPRILSDGSEVALVTSGICTEEALKVTTRMGVSIFHIHLSTLVPFPADVIVEAARKTKYGMIVMENHSIIGGVGSAAAEVLAGHGVGRKLVRLGVPGVYAHGASCGYLMQEYGFDASALVRAVEALVGRSVSLSFAYLQVKDSLKNVMSPNERPEDL